MVTECLNILAIPVNPCPYSVLRPRRHSASQLVPYMKCRELPALIPMVHDHINWYNCPVSFTRIGMHPFSNITVEPVPTFVGNTVGRTTGSPCEINSCSRKSISQGKSKNSFLSCKTIINTTSSRNNVNSIWATERKRCCFKCCVRVSVYPFFILLMNSSGE